MLTQHKGELDQKAALHAEEMKKLVAKNCDVINVSLI